MGRIKETMVEFIPDEVIFDRYKDQLEYEEWLQSDGFVEYVNGEIDMTKARYSELDITSAIRYASQQITINPSDIGKEVYDMLFSEKIEEYLSLYI